MAVGIVLTLVLGGILWLGLQVAPTAFAEYPEPTREPETIPLPSGLPAPVERFYRTTYGDALPSSGVTRSRFRTPSPSRLKYPPVWE